MIPVGAKVRVIQRGRLNGLTGVVKRMVGDIPPFNCLVVMDSYTHVWPDGKTVDNELIFSPDKIEEVKGS